MFHATIREGKLSFGPVLKRQFQDFMIKHEGRQISIDLVSKTRSTTQNSYYWLYLGVVERETGQLADDIHQWAKRKFLPPRFITINGEEIRIPSSTTDLSKTDFGDYIDKLAAEIGIALPDPQAAGYLPR
jgi:hypothetical protein